MTLQEIKEAVDRLRPDELRELREYLDQRESIERTGQELSPVERARRLNEAFDQLREGLTEQQLKEITDAINAEYIEPFDEDEWKD